VSALPDDRPFPETVFRLNVFPTPKVTVPAALTAPPAASDPNATELPTYLWGTRARAFLRARARMRVCACVVRAWL
jgi:hypothetical protein